ncbi:MAG TPA: MlaD family protein, partial [Solirubrobacterales bacterium]|nr:MlaD family protein [Solirubrobacterales bacterium]
AALILGGAFAFAATAVGEDEHTYYLEFDNAFGLVEGSEVKVAGVQQGVIEDLFISPDKTAVVRVKLSGPLSTLGEETICSSEPQSLIAEYFIDCIPKGAPLDEDEGIEDERVGDPDVPVEQTRQTVQNDLVLSGLRQPFKERLSLIINEFGTALAGNPENLNAAIRRGAPALRSARKVTRILAGQNRIIKNLNVNSDTIMSKLAERRRDVVRFIENAKVTAEVGADNRDALSANFRDLDDFLAELGPTMVELNDLAVTQTPLLRNLRASAGGLDTLSQNLPDFNSASTRSLVTLGDAAVVGRRALNKGADEIRQLKKSSRQAFSAADHLRKFLNDINDPGRAVEVDSRAATDSGRSAPTGYTGLEGLLNYVYYQAGALTQYDQISHLLHFSIFEVGSGPCAEYNAEDHVPAAGGGITTDITEADRCVAWLGPNQPGINQNVRQDPYPGSVCPDGSDDLEICNPANTSAAGRDGGSDGGGEGLPGDGDLGFLFDD